jgi:3-hydroxyacyl-CoA dehydrogenase / enoyl-CoA hydratase / 3-hydroxybutyryl-CoA epimerase
MSVFYKEEGIIGYITFDAADAKVNVLSSPVLVEFEKILDEFKNTSAIKAIVIQSAKKDIFIAGADIKEIENITEIPDGKAKSQAGQRILNKLQDLPVPTIAVIDGAALGGGCELALSCRYRIATFNDKVRIGLPEVNLGFVPGFGGTYRLPRLVGLQGSLKLILSGNPIDANAAFKMGLVDRLYPQAGLADRVKEFAAEIAPFPRGRIIRRPAKKGLDAFLDNNSLGQSLVFSKSRKQVLKATKGFYPAPIAALDVVQRTLALDRRAALEIESSEFAKLAVTPLSKNLVKVFYLSEKFKKLSVPGAEAVKPQPVRKAGVIGAGIMGGGVAQLLSNRGVWVRLKDINHDAIAKGLKAAYDVYQQSVKRRRLKPSELAVKMAMINGTLDYSGFQDADFVIEAVVENLDIKKKIFAELGAQAPKAVLATNTSSLSVTEMAKVAKDPAKVIGFHFFNPVHRMPLLEIITAPQTSKETLVTTLEFAKRLGKVPIMVKDAPGFLVNRILLGYINEAGRLLEDGLSIERADQVAVDFGMPMGPFTLSDEVGLDVGVKVLHILEAGLGPRFKAGTVFERVAEKKLLGKKSGKGFYIHGKTRVVNPEVVEIVAGLRKNARRNKAISAQEALDRMIYIMVNEAAMILQEGVVDGPDTVDVGMIMGTGFPPFRGGLLRYADSVGISQVIKTMEGFESEYKDGRFVPCAYLLDLKKQGRKFFN